MGLSTINFDDDHFEAVLNRFVAAGKPVANIADALKLAPPGAGVDLVEAALLHWRAKTEAGVAAGAARHKVGTFPFDRPGDPYVVFRPPTAPPATTRSATRRALAKRESEESRGATQSTFHFIPRICPGTSPKSCFE